MAPSTTQQAIGLVMVSPAGAVSREAGKERAVTPRTAGFQQNLEETRRKKK